MATLSAQCWLFAVGSSLFALATAPAFPAFLGAGGANLLCFCGSWFFTTAASLQLYRCEHAKRAEWWSAAVQLVGTALFNVSTGASVWAHAVASERRYVWVPDVAGSTAFLISGLLGVVAAGALIDLTPRDWMAAAVNMAGCVAFGVSAGAAFVRATGVTEDERLANLGTFIGALCFLASALMLLPRQAASSA